MQASLTHISNRTLIDTYERAYGRREANPGAEAKRLAHLEAMAAEIETRGIWIHWNGAAIAAWGHA